MGARIVGTCSTGKLRYPNEVEAMIALANARAKRERRNTGGKVETRYYSCDICRGGYHLTHLTEEQQAARHAARKERWKQR